MNTRRTRPTRPLALGSKTAAPVAGETSSRQNQHLGGVKTNSTLTSNITTVRNVQ